MLPIPLNVIWTLVMGYSIIIVSSIFLRWIEHYAFLTIPNGRWLTR